jgi:hypothetical protein
MLKRGLLLIVLLIFSLPVLAGDISATYQYSNGQDMTISVRDASHVRMDTTPDSYMLLKGQKIYIVSKDENGKWSAMDLDQMKGMAGMMGGFLGKKGKTPEYDMKLTDTGRKEEIAGFTGNVYSATYYENNKAIDTKEIVFCNKKEIKQINDAWITVAASLAQIMGQEMTQLLEKSNKLAKENNYGVMIRMGNDMKLKSLTQTSLKDSYYELPPGVEVMDIDKSMNESQGTQESQENNDSENTISQDAEDAGQAAKDEAGNTTKVDKVKKGAKSLFNGIFNK